MVCLRSSEDVIVVVGNGEINIVWVLRIIMTILVFINMRICCGFLVNKGYDLIYVLK